MKRFGKNRCVILLLAAIGIHPAIRSEVFLLEKDYDFGVIKEIAGPANGSVRMVNSGPEEIVITGARPSCGCTGVDYPKEPVAPGDTVTISFTYDPEGRPGKFRKSIRVYTGTTDTYRIGIRGTVLGTPESLSTIYPVEVGAIRLPESILPAGEVTYGSTRQVFLNAYNQTADSISPRALCDNPSLHIDASAVKAGPGDIVTYSLYFNSRDMKEPGEVEIPITLISDDRPGAPQTTVLFRANVVPDYSGFTAESLKEAPQLTLMPRSIDAGSVKGKKTLNLKLEVINTGAFPLNISRIISPDNALRVKKFPSSLKSSKGAAIEVTLNPQLLEKGPFKKTIEIYSNDPLHPVMPVDVTGILE